MTAKYYLGYGIGDTVYYLGESDGTARPIHKAEIMSLYLSIDDINYDENSPINKDANLYLISFKTHSYDMEKDLESIVIATEFASEKEIFGSLEYALEVCYKELIEGFDAAEQKSAEKDNDKTTE